jgi:hypothetical protein
MPFSIQKMFRGFGGLLLIHAALTALIVGITFSVTNELFFKSFLFGQALVWISLITISLPMTLFFFKKDIALIVGIIVLKWPILIYFVYLLTRMIEHDLAQVVIGFMPIFVSSLLWSVFQKD